MHVLISQDALVFTFEFSLHWVSLCIFTHISRSPPFQEPYGAVRLCLINASVCNKNIAEQKTISIVVSMSSAKFPNTLAACNSATARAEFPLARAALDGFGPGDVTLRQLQKFLDSNQRS